MMGLVFDDKVDAAVGTIFYLEGNIRKIIDQYFVLKFLIQDRVSISEPHVPIVNIYSTYVVPK